MRSKSDWALTRVRCAPLWKKWLAIFLGGAIGAAVGTPLFDTSAIVALAATFAVMVLAMSLIALLLTLD